MASATDNEHRRKQGGTDGVEQLLIPQPRRKKKEDDFVSTYSSRCRPRLLPRAPPRSRLGCRRPWPGWSAGTISPSGSLKRIKMSLNEGRGRKRVSRTAERDFALPAHLYMAVGGARLKSSATDEAVSILVNVLLHSSSSFRFCPDPSLFATLGSRKSPAPH